MLYDTCILCFSKNLLHCIVMGDLKMSKKTALPPKYEGGCNVDQWKEQVLRLQTLPLINCVVFGKLINFSGPPISHFLLRKMRVMATWQFRGSVNETANAKQPCIAGTSHV